MRDTVLRKLVFMAALGAGACNSHADNVCEDIGNCSQGGLSSWIDGCKTEAQALNDEADDAGCGPAFDNYYSCADSNYQCQGATALFPGCDDLLTALDVCLETATAATSCARLLQAEKACSPPGPDGGSAPDAGVPAQPPPACTALRDCEAGCFLGVKDVCAPQVNELQSFATCAAQCPL